MSIHILSLDGWATQDVDDVDDMDLSWEVDATELTAEKEKKEKKTSPTMFFKQTDRHP